MSFKSYSIKRQLLTGFAGVVLAFVVLLAFVIWQVTVVNAANEQVTVQNDQLDLAVDSSRQALYMNRTLLNAMVHEGQEPHLSEAVDDNAERGATLRDNLVQIDGLLRTEEGRARYERYQTSFEEVDAVWDQMLTAMQQGDMATVDQLNDDVLPPLQTEMAEAVDAMVDNYHTLVSEATDEAAAASSRMMVIIIVACVGGGGHGDGRRAVDRTVHVGSCGVERGACGVLGGRCGGGGGSGRGGRRGGVGAVERGGGGG